MIVLLFFVLRVWKATRLENSPRQLKLFHLSGYGVKTELDIWGSVKGQLCYLLDSLSGIIADVFV